MILILVGVSCSGKTAILERIIDKYNFQRLVTLTTRPPRKSEIDGVDYFFISEKEFLSRKQEGRVILPVTYRGYSYGMPETYFLPTFGEKQKLITILLPIGIPVVKNRIRENGTNQNVVAIYIEPETKDFLRKGYELKTGLPFNEREFDKENLSIINDKNACDYIVINRYGYLDNVTAEIMEIVNREESRTR